MISEKKCTRCSFLHGTLAAPKSQQGTRKNCVPDFLILSGFKLPHVDSGFYKYEHFIYLQQVEPEISKHSRKKIIQLL